MVVGFLGDLWRSIFEPGSSPAVVIATNASFFLLVATLILMLFLTHSIHFAFLLVLSVALWITTAWFIDEYNKYLEQEKKNKLESAPDFSDSVVKASSSASSDHLDTTHRQPTK